MELDLTRDALAAVESVLLLMIEKGVLQADDVVEALEDAAAPSDATGAGQASPALQRLVRSIRAARQSREGAAPR